MQKGEPSLPDRVINLHNTLSDKNFIWFPFLFLKPSPEEFITQERIIKMTACFGLYGTLVLILKNFISTGSIILSTNSLFIFLGFFVWFQLVTSRLWNIRARQLEGQS